MDEKVINGIRSLSIDMINNANSGHPGICLGAAPIMYTLFTRHLKFNPNDGNWINRDRFIMSSGHGSALLYSTLFFAGYPITLNDLKTYRHIDSICTGHPKFNPSIGIEATTGALGSGFGMSIGMAIAEEYLRNNISSEIFNNYTYVLVSDGDLMEGISYEACSLAGTLKLGKLIVLYDSNNITLDGKTEGVFEEDVLKRFESCGWHTILVSNGEDVNSIDNAIKNAKEVNDKPSIIKINTIIGYTSKNQNTPIAHSGALDEEDAIKVKERLGVNKIPFYVSKESAEYFRGFLTKNKNIYDEWMNKYNNVLNEKSVLSKTLKYMKNNDFHINLKKIKINMDDKYNEELRIVNGKIINLLSSMCPVMMSGSADVSRSTKAIIDGTNGFLPGNRGRNISFGVREHLMGEVLNGLALNGIRPIGSTFLTFSDYLKPSLRNSALMNAPVTYVFTHDTFAIGQDGETHAPIEQLGHIRSIPNMTVLRPCDIREIVGCWDYIMNNKKPISLIISKDKFPPLVNTSIEGIYRGAYIIKKERTRLSGIILSCGSEVHKAIEISNVLERKGVQVRVISVPSLEIFENESTEYKKELLPDGVKTIVIEASNDSKWLKYVYGNKYILNVKNYSKSGTSEELNEYYEFDTVSLLEKVEMLLK